MLRLHFQYERVPSVSLCISLLELYSDAEKCAEASVALVLDLSRRLALAPESVDTASVAPITQRLTEFAMKKFQIAGRTER